MLIYLILLISTSYVESLPKGVVSIPWIKTPIWKSCDDMPCTKDFVCVMHESPEYTGPLCLPAGPSTCKNVKCSAGFHCIHQEVVCVRAPCYPQPMCVPNDDPNGNGGAYKSAPENGNNGNSDDYSRCKALNCPYDQVCVRDLDGDIRCGMHSGNDCNCKPPQLCIVQEIVCITTPCNPIGNCVSPKGNNGNECVPPLPPCAPGGMCIVTPEGQICATPVAVPHIAPLGCDLVCDKGKECVITDFGPRCNPTSCGEHETVSNCGNLCEGNCQKSVCNPPLICPEICGPPECACEEGYFRNKDGACVPKDQCLPECSSTPGGPPHACNLFCIKGYHCVVTETGAQCVKDQPECDENEEISGCGNLCEATCENRCRPVPCPLICNPPACACKQNFYREPTSKKCVPSDKCPDCSSFPIPEPFPEPFKCGENQHFDRCGNHCEGKCEFANSGPRPCILICGPPACSCDANFFRNDGGECVTKEECASTPTEPVNPCAFTTCLAPSDCIVVDGKARCVAPGTAAGGPSPYSRR